MRYGATLLALTAVACMMAVPTESRTPASMTQGIYGKTVAAWGNPPANPPTTQCVKVLDPDTRQIVATATCSGTWGAFRLELPAGTYLVQVGGHYESSGGTVKFVPDERTVTVPSGKWVEAYRPPSPPGPVP